jgi:hypothetical protein
VRVPVVVHNPLPFHPKSPLAVSTALPTNPMKRLAAIGTVAVTGICSSDRHIVARLRPHTVARHRDSCWFRALGGTGHQDITTRKFDGAPLSRAIAIQEHVSRQESQRLRNDSMEMNKTLDNISQWAAECAPRFNLDVLLVQLSNGCPKLVELLRACRHHAGRLSRTRTRRHCLHSRARRRASQSRHWRRAPRDPLHRAEFWTPQQTSTPD